MIRVGLVGLGRWGKTLLGVFHKRCQVTLCCNRKDLNARSWLQEYYPQVRHTFDFEEILKDPSVQAVVIATPSLTHVPLACQALEAGKHVFVEKPMATNYPDAKYLAQTAREAGRVLFVGHVFLYHPVLKKIKEFTERDPILYTKMVWDKLGAFEEDILWSLACHDIAMALELFRAYPSEAAVLQEKGVVTARDLISVRLWFDAGRECLIDVNRCVPTRRKSLTVLTAGGRTLVWVDESLYILRDGGIPDLVFVNEEEALGIEADAFLHDVQSGVPAQDRYSLALQVVELVGRLERA